MIEPPYDAAYVESALRIWLSDAHDKQKDKKLKDNRNPFMRALFTEDTLRQGAMVTSGQSTVGTRVEALARQLARKRHGSDCAPAEIYGLGSVVGEPRPVNDNGRTPLAAQVLLHRVDEASLKSLIAKYLPRENSVLTPEVCEGLALDGLNLTLTETLSHQSLDLYLLLRVMDSDEKVDKPIELKSSGDHDKNSATGERDALARIVALRGGNVSPTIAFWSDPPISEKMKRQFAPDFVWDQAKLWQFLLPKDVTVTQFLSWSEEIGNELGRL